MTRCEGFSWKKRGLFAGLAVLLIAAAYFLFCPREAVVVEKSVFNEKEKKILQESRRMLENWGDGGKSVGEILSTALAVVEIEEEAKSELSTEDVAALRALSEDWGLVLCVMEHCPWCEKFAPVVAELAKIGGFSVHAIGFDEGRVGPFPVQENPEYFDILNPEAAAPLLFLARKEGNDVLPIARGYEGIANVVRSLLGVVEVPK